MGLGATNFTRAGSLGSVHKSPLELIDDGQPAFEGRKPWRDIWSAGQGVGSIDDLPPVAGLVARLELEFDAAGARFRRRQN